MVKFQLFFDIFREIINIDGDPDLGFKALIDVR